MLTKRFIYRLKQEYCIDDYTQIEGFWNAYNSDIPSNKYCVHHKYGIVLNKTKEQLKYMGLYYNRYARELQIMLRSDHTSLHRKDKPAPWNSYQRSEEHKRNISEANKGENNPMYGKRGENSPMYGKNAEDYMTEEAIKEKRRKQSESHKGKSSPIKDKHRVYDNKELNIFHYE